MPIIIKPWPRRKSFLMPFLLLLISFSAIVQYVASANSQSSSNESQTGSGAARKAEAPKTLELGQAIERELKGSERHSYEVKLQAGEFLKLNIEFKDFDMGAEISDPAGKKVLEYSMIKFSGASGKRRGIWVKF
jgi:hypothetical protein